VEQAQLQAGNVGPALTLTTSNAPGKFLTGLWIYVFIEITNDSNYSQDAYTDNLFDIFPPSLETETGTSFRRCFTRT